jgi:hypothetical protein
VCPLSGKRPSAHCPHRKREYFAHGHGPDQVCDWHRHEGGRAVVAYPAEARAWAERERRRGGRQAAGTASSGR